MLLTEMTQAKQCHRSLSKYSKPPPRRQRTHGVSLENRRVGISDKPGHVDPETEQ